MPAWRGEDIAGRCLLVWNEQGFGDALLYARYLPILARQGADVHFMCESPLARLMSESFKDTVTVHTFDAAPPVADLHASIMSLPHLLRTTIENIPADVPYLKADAVRTDAWRTKLSAAAGGRPCVGLVWAGNPGQAHDYSRSMSPETIAPLLDVDGVQFVNLLVGPRGDAWRDTRLFDPRENVGDFADSAALMTALDLIISVDSAPAHLAGALARPLWIALAFDPDSRYFVGRDDSPWYPTAHLFRQEAPGAWPGVIDRLTDSLPHFLDEIAKS